jgi:Domain of unknown function (DUF1876)
MGYHDTDDGTKHQVVLIAVDEDDDNTRATARLAWRGTTLEGVGRARLEVGDDYTIELRDELAVARALSNLANQLFAASVSEIETATGQRRPKLTPLSGGRP